MGASARRLVVIVALAAGAAAPSRPPLQPVPSPEQVIGFRPGTDRKLADFSQITRYFRALAEASPRVQLFSIGKSTEGREMVLAAISSEENLRRLARFKDIARQLADSRGLNDDQARQLAREGRAIVWIDFGLHATEVGHAQVSAEVAHMVATSDSAEMKRIRDDVIFVTVPVMNPDGLDIVANWYRAQVGTPFEGTTPPVLYQKYAGHDNNRDWYMQNLAETRVITEQLYHEWFPQVLYNQHQSGLTSPRIWTPPMDDPVNPNMHPLINRGITTLGVGIQQRLEQEGKTGAEGFSQYSNWWNGGMRSTPCFHNIVSILTEVASGQYASPVEISPRQLPQTLASGEGARVPSTWNPSPWPGGRWTFRDQVEYMVIGSMAVLRLGAEYREDWLYNRYQMARDQVAAGKKGDPYAYVIPAGENVQHDWPTAYKLAHILSLGDVEIHVARTNFMAGGRQYGDGSFVVLMAQPNRGYAKDLLEPQHHPNRTNGAGGPPKRPYDMAGWTLSYQMGVRADPIEAPFDAKLELIKGWGITGSVLGGLPEPPKASPAGAAAAAVVPVAPIGIDRRANDAVALAMQALARGSRVWSTPTRIFVDGADEKVLVDAISRLKADQQHIALPSDARPLRTPRVGIYKSYLASMDEGWTRYVLEQFDVPFTSIENKDVRAGILKSRFDAIILPNQDVDAIVNGHAAGTMPPEFAGGIGFEGVAALRAFVEGGGTLFAVDAASTLPIRYFNMPVRDALDGVRNTEFYCPGSLLRLKIDTAQPLTAGMPAEQAAFFVNGRAFDVGPRAGGRGGASEAAAGPVGRRRFRPACASSRGTPRTISSCPGGSTAEAASPARRLRSTFPSARATSYSPASACSSAASRTARSNFCSIPSSKARPAAPRPRRTRDDDDTTMCSDDGGGGRGGRRSAGAGEVGGRSDEGSDGERSARRSESERGSDDRGSDPLLRDSGAVVQGDRPRRGAEESVPAARPAERAHRQGGQRARRSARRRAAAARRHRRAPRHRVSRGHRREGAPRRRRAPWPGHRRRLPRPWRARRHHPSDEAGERADARVDHLRGRRRRRGPRRSARHEAVVQRDAERASVDRFVSIDGTGLSLTHVFVGSHRYRVTFKGPGGHSFGAFGLANPTDALGRAVAKIADFQVPKDPKTTFNVGRIGGGTSVNSIPFEAWMEVDMRSVDKAALASVDASFHKAVDSALVEENARWGTPGMLTVTKDLVGDRPAGSMTAEAPIVKIAMDVTHALGWTPTSGAGSSDANYPVSLGIPSLDIGGGGRAPRRTRSARRSIRPTRGWGRSARCC